MVAAHPELRFSKTTERGGLVHHCEWTRGMGGLAQLATISTVALGLA